MKAMRRAALAIMLAPVSGLAAAPSPALTSAAPSPDSVVQGMPTVVVLTFSAGVQTVGSRITVKAADGKRVDTADLHNVGDDRHLAVGVKMLLPGRYLVTWHVAGAETRSANGSFGFTVGQ